MFIDDMILSGTHITERIFSIPELETLLVHPDTKIYILAPIFVTPSIFKKNFYSIGKHVLSSKYGRYNPIRKEKTRQVAERVMLISGIVYDSEKYPHIIVDHNGADKYDVEVAYGFGGYNNGKPILIGSLIEGADLESARPYRYPPPLYYLTFGNGKLPKVFQHDFEIFDYIEKYN